MASSNNFDSSPNIFIKKVAYHINNAESDPAKKKKMPRVNEGK